MIIKEDKAGHIEIEFTWDEIEKLGDICNFAMIKAPYASEIYDDALDFGSSFYSLL